MCHQTVSLIARYLEARSIPTVCLASALDIVQAARPPRAVFLDYPLGHTAGRPFDFDDQRAVVWSAVTALEIIAEAGDTVHLDRRWDDDERWRHSAVGGSGDSRTPRYTTPQYQCESDRIAAQGQTS